MTVILAAFIAYCLITAKYKNPFRNDYHYDNFEKASTECINGIFVALVFLSHFHWEVEKFWPIDTVYLKFQMLCGQCIVCSFLFYSGYGIYESMKKDRLGYAKKLMQRKFPCLLLRFDFCVILYAIVQLCMGSKVGVTDFLLSLITVRNLGNSNWYITYMLFMYFIIWISFSVFKDDKKSLLSIVLVNAVYTLLFAIYNPRVSHYYVTSFILPLGMYFSKYKDRIEKLLGKRIFYVFIITACLYFVCWFLKSKLRLPEVTYNIISLLFTLTLIFMTYTVKLKNRFLELLGKNVFQIYIMQHLPMIVFKSMQKYSDGGGYLVYLVLCVAGTALLTAVTNLFFKKIKI